MCYLETIVRRYNDAQILINFQTLNNIIAYKILHACRGIWLDNFWHQTIGNVDKLIEQKSKENTTKIATSIFLVIKMHIRPTRLLENSITNTNYDSKKRLFKDS